MKYKDKKILVVGFGVEGKALVDYFLDQEAKVSVADQKSQPELGQAYIDYQDKVDWKLGDGYLDGLTEFDLIAYSPGLKLAAYQKIQSSGVSTVTQMQLFFSQSPTKNIIGVTGTKGKGTTSTLIYEVLKQSGKTVYLAGNIGAGVLSLLKFLKPEDWVILELSSYQLRDLTVSPHIAIVLNITPDHLDVHPSFEDYVSSKANIVRFQKEDDFALLNNEYPETRKLAELTKAQIRLFSKDDFRKSGLKLEIPGEHNFENAAAVLGVVEILGIKSEVVSGVFEEFSGLPHRLEEVAMIRGVKFIDDSFATSPSPTIVGIKAFKQPKLVILGGFGKIDDFSELASAIQADSSVKRVLAIGNSGSKIIEALRKVGYDQIEEGFANIQQVVKKAQELAEPGDIVLLSPADSSFDWFKNYADRGEKFAEAVLKMR